MHWVHRSDQKVGGTNTQQLRGCDRPRGFWGRQEGNREYGLAQLNYILQGISIGDIIHFWQKLSMSVFYCRRHSIYSNQKYPTKKVWITLFFE